MSKLTRSALATTLGLLLLAVLPVIFNMTGNAYYIDLATRLVILGIAAVSLNLILGYGGLISFGHAAYLGLGAYAVGIPAHHVLWGGFDAIATTNGVFQFVLAVVVSALFALVTGAICLRTKGVYFIMITMAFAQMIYYLFLSIETYGGDDGLVIDMRSELPAISFDNPLHLYYFCFASLLVAMGIVHLIVNSRFGMVIQGAKGNNERMVTMGYNTYLYRLTAYVISGAMCGFAGALLGNFTTFISPTMMEWSRSGELMFMVILGGTSTVFGPVLGSATFIVIEELLEEVMGHYSEYWHLPFGLLLMAIVLFARGGLMGLIRGKGK
jgi:branched-chain amino acid transport system permease protein